MEQAKIQARQAEFDKLVAITPSTEHQERLRRRFARKLRESIAESKLRIALYDERVASDLARHETLRIEEAADKTVERLKAIARDRFQVAGKLKKSALRRSECKIRESCHQRAALRTEFSSPRPAKSNWNWPHCYRKYPTPPLINKR